MRAMGAGLARRSGVFTGRGGPPFHSAKGKFPEGEGAARLFQWGCPRRWPDAVPQECLVNVQRNVGDSMGKWHRAKIKRRFKRLRQAQGAKDGPQAFGESGTTWGSTLPQRGELGGSEKARCGAIHRLEGPFTRNATFLSSPLIEQRIRHWRGATPPIKREQLKAMQWIAGWPVHGWGPKLGSKRSGLRGIYQHALILFQNTGPASGNKT